MLRAALFQYVNPENANDPEFISAVNEVRSEFIEAGKWKGCVRKCTYQTDTNGQITLAPEHDSLLAVTVHSGPVPIFSEFHRYVDVGPGLIKSENQSGWPFYDLPGNYCTVADIPDGSSGVLRTTPQLASDVAKVNRYFGLDQNGDEVFDSSGNRGEAVIMAVPFVDTIKSFSKVTGVQKQASNGRETLSCMTASATVVLNVYQPYETLPVYHRYQVGTVTADTQYADQTISGLARLKYIPVTAETDFVIPDQIRAYKLGLLARLNENSPNDQNRGTASRFWSDAYRILDNQLGASKGGARKTLNWSRRPSRNSI